MNADARIDGLLSALAAVGARPAPSPRGAPGLAALDAALAPLRLPADLRRFFERIDPRELPVVPYPPISDLEFALWGWREQVDVDDSFFPAGLFPFAYESWNHLVIELDGAGSTPGAIFEWGFGDTEFVLRLTSFGDWLEITTQALEEGLFELHTMRDATVAVIDHERWRELARRALEARAPHPLYDDRVTFPDDPDEWPEHWKHADTLGREVAAPQSAPCTVRELLDTGGSRRTAGVIGGFYTAVLARAGTATHLVLWDDSGKIHVECPPTTPGHAALDLAGHATIEVELAPPRDPDSQLDAWFGLTPAEVAAITPPQAIAKVIRTGTA